MFGKKKKRDDWDVPERVETPGYYRQTDYYDNRRPDMTNPGYDQMAARHSGEYYSNGRYPDLSGDMEKDNGYFRKGATYYDGGYSGSGYNGVGYRDQGNGTVNEGPRYYDARPGYDQRRPAQDRYARERYAQDRYAQDRYQDPRMRRAGSREDDYDRRRSAGRVDDYERRRRGGRGQEAYDPRGSRGQFTGRVPVQPMRRPKKKHTGLKVFLVLLLILILAMGGLYFAVFGRMDHHSLNDLLTNAGIGSKAGYSTFVLYGVDSRTGDLTKDCHSDTIMLVSLNKKSKEIRLASVYRDTYLDNTNGEYRKATECYFYGGPERSINMLNKNLDLDISDYMAVNFNAVVQMIDLVGGIDLEITEEEMGYINGYCVENQQVTGVGYTPLSTFGAVHLDGIQALAYCRIRYTAGWDYKRTERQRTVLTKVFQKASGMGPTTLLSIVNTMIPQISTSMNTVELVSLATSLSTCKLGEQTGFPFDKTDSNLNVGDCVVPVNLAANVSQLHAFLYDESDYSPSATVQQISQEITYATGV